MPSMPIAVQATLYKRERHDDPFTPSLDFFGHYLGRYEDQ